MTTATSPGSRLRELVAEATIQVPGAPSALLARLIEHCGYDAMYLSGSALSAGTLGLPDVGLVTLTELTQHAIYLTRACGLPLIVDADTGFGETLNVERTVVELEEAGAAAIQLEDRRFPKRTGQLPSEALVEPAAMCAKLCAAAGAKGDPDLVIIAGTVARGVTGLDDAIERAKRYLAAGADWILPAGLKSPEEFEHFARAVEAPLVANMEEFGNSPLLTLEELAELGYSAVLYPDTLLRIATKAAEAALNLLAVEGTQSGLLDLMHPPQEVHELLNYHAFLERDRGHAREEDS